ncbi:MAG: hypothetical protein HN368_04975 [Spirochaetales bacterium]|nr:hypothetical protein [Spirochaetales bacterium]
MKKELFPINLLKKQWCQFEAAGFEDPACGVIHGYANPAVCGMPLGGIDTGCIDLETSGLFGYASIFNSHVPRRGPMNLPFLGMSTGGRTWVFCDPKQTKAYNVLRFDNEAGFYMNKMDFGVAHPAVKFGESQPDPLSLPGVNIPTEIHYWGHYPVADLEYEIDAPINLGLRAWSPFIPGDIKTSTLPGAVFEVHIRNTSDDRHEGTVAFSFPGPTEEEAGSIRFQRAPVRGAFSGVTVKGKKASYSLGIVGDKEPRVGTDLGKNAILWKQVAERLPNEIGTTYTVPDIADHSGPGIGPGASVAVDFNLDAGETEIVRFILAWHAPEWRGGGSAADSETNTFYHMYTQNYMTEEHAAFALAFNHESYLKRILAWQQTIYAEEALPVWMREVLVNNFHLITEVGMWAQVKAPVGDWCKPEDGIWAQNESPRACPQLECGPNSYYGGMAVQFFFPELTLSTLRAYKAYMYPDGCPTWIFGGITAGTPWCEMTMPTRGYQKGQNGSWVVAMAYRYWRATGDDAVLSELYLALKQMTLFTFRANPDEEYGLISLPEYDQNESFEGTPFKGMAGHVGIIRLYHLKVMEQIALRVGDRAFAERCIKWYKESLNLLEKHLWTGSYYLQYKDPRSGDSSDVIMAYQLDGEFMAQFDALGESILPIERIKKVLKTIGANSIVNWGARVWSNSDGGPPDFEAGYFTKIGVHAPSALMLAMTYMYHGEKKTGLALAEKVMNNMILRNGWSWDMPILFRGDTGEGIFGNDYAQMMTVWDLPAATLEQDIVSISDPVGLVSKIIDAGKE